MRMPEQFIKYLNGLCSSDSYELLQWITRNNHAGTNGMNSIANHLVRNNPAINTEITILPSRRPRV